MHVKEIAVSILKYSCKCKYLKSILKTQGENEDVGSRSFQAEDHTLMPVLEARFSLHQSPSVIMSHSVPESYTQINP